MYIAPKRSRLGADLNSPCDADPSDPICQELAKQGLSKQSAASAAAAQAGGSVGPASAATASAGAASAGVSPALLIAGGLAVVALIYLVRSRA
jgi:hypothetical protein